MSKKISKNVAMERVTRCGGVVVDGKIMRDEYGNEAVVHLVEPPANCGIKCWSAVDALTRYYGFALGRVPFGPVVRF